MPQNLPRGRLGLAPLLDAISPLFEPILFHLIEQVCLAAAKVDNLRTPIPVLLLKQSKNVFKSREILKW